MPRERSRMKESLFLALLENRHVFGGLFCTRDLAVVCAIGAPFKWLGLACNSQSRMTDS